MAQAKCIGRYESIYDLEEACFRNYRETMQTILQTTGNITDAEWGRNHDRYRDNVIHDFDKNCGHFKKRDLVRNVRESLIERIETENLDLIKLYELRTMNQAMQESLQESKATTDKSRETVTQLKSVREEQNKTLEENNARLARLSSQQSNAREQYSNMSRELAGVEEYMAKLERQRQDQKREQHDLEEQARRNAMRLEELKRSVKEKEKNKDWWKIWKRRKNDGHASNEFEEQINDEEEHSPADHHAPSNTGHYHHQTSSRNPKQDELSEKDANNPPVFLKGNDAYQIDDRNAGWEFIAVPSHADKIRSQSENTGAKVPQQFSENTSNGNFSKTNEMNHATTDESVTETSPELDSGCTQNKSTIHDPDLKIGDTNSNLGNASSINSAHTKEEITLFSSIISKYDDSGTNLQNPPIKPDSSQATKNNIFKSHGKDRSLWEPQKTCIPPEDDNSNCKVVTVRHVDFDAYVKSPNPQTIMHNLPANNTHSNPEILECASNDIVGDLIDLGNEGNVNSNTPVDAIGTSDVKNVSPMLTQDLLSSIITVPSFETTLVSNDDENVVKVHALKNDLPQSFVTTNLVVSETKHSEPTAVIKPLTNEIKPISQLQNTLGLALKPFMNLSATLSAKKNPETDQATNDYSVPPQENVQSLNQLDENNQFTQENQNHENLIKKEESNCFKIVDLV